MSAKNPEDVQSESPDIDTAPGEQLDLPDTTDENGRPVDNPSG